MLIEEEANGPDLLRFERTLGTHFATAVPGAAFACNWIEL
jgi:hypothetical protein